MAGYKENALKWLRSQVGNNLKDVFNMSEFQIWANKGKNLTFLGLISI